MKDRLSVLRYSAPLLSPGEYKLNPIQSDSLELQFDAVSDKVNLDCLMSRELFTVVRQSI